MSIQQTVKDWVVKDNEIRNYQNKIKELKTEKNELSDEIKVLLRESNMQNAVIEISDGKLKLQETKQYSTITLSYLKNCLSVFIKNSNDVDKILNYVKENRDIKYVQDLKRY